MQSIPLGFGTVRLFLSNIDIEILNQTNTGKFHSKMWSGSRDIAENPERTMFTQEE